MVNESDDNILTIEDLRVRFTTALGEFDAVRGVSFTVRRGSTLAVVGESGSGKSVTGYSILRLIQPPGKMITGKMLFAPREQREIDIAALPENSATMLALRGGKIGMIFQEPMTALSPVHTIGDQLTEAVRIHRGLGKAGANEMACEMMARVGITEPKRRLRQYPFEFSGGMRQRVVIAMALMCRPELLIADEPTTALDVTVQAQVLKLLRELRNELAMSVIFITHDLAVVAQVADDVVVMNAGQIVESGPVREILRRPSHTYTRKLLAAVPRFDSAEAS
jgi:peptide/nickel transport system ATP-binding protein